MTSKCYLVDFENTGNANLPSFSQAEEGDMVVLVFTENNYRLDMRMTAGIKANLSLQQVPTGPQSADMHLVSLLGYYIAKGGKDTEYIIVSKDRDFEPVCRFWSERGYSVRRLEIPAKEQEDEDKCSDTTPAAQSAESCEKQVPKRTAFNATLMAGLSGVEQTVKGQIAKIVFQHIDEKNKGLVAIYRQLVKTYGQKQGLQYYNMVKKLLEKY